jgi:hypothetical protein
MTPEQITAAAHRMALAGIDDWIDDASGINENLDLHDDLAAGSTDDEWETATEAVEFELKAIRDELAARWSA